MISKNTSNKSDEHAFLSPSKYHWINYTPEKLVDVYKNELRKRQGVILHEFASQCINLNMKLELREGCVNAFVNDCIDNKMQSEQLLFFSEFCFGTADAINFEDNLLSIWDLKTGKTKASFNQLLIYAALFCLENLIKPEKINYDLRIYQGCAVLEYAVDPKEIRNIMGLIKRFTKILEKTEGDTYG